MFRWNQTITAALVLAWLGCAWLLAYEHYQARARSILAQKTADGNRDAQDIADRIKKNIQYFHGIPAMLAGEPIILQALASSPSTAGQGAPPPGPNEPPAIDPVRQQQLNDFLARVTRTLGTDAAWVMNSAGDCIAASNAHETNSFVGANFSDRDYFRQSQKSKTGQQYAFGRLTLIPGLYFAAAVIVDGRPAGAVAVKMNVDELSGWVDVNDAFLTDGLGVVVLASDPQLLMQTAPKAAANRLSIVKRQERYHRDAFTPLSIQSWGSTNLGHLVIFNHETTPRMLFSRTVPLEGLRIYVPVPVPEILTLGRDRSWYFALLAVSGGSLILLVSATLQYIQARQRANRVLLGQKNLLTEAERIARLGSWNCDLAGGGLELSEQAAEIFKRPSTPPPAAASFFAEAARPADRERVKSTFEEALRQRTSCNIEYGLAESGAGGCTVHLLGRFVEDGGNQPARMVGTVQDVTERKRAEEELFKSRETLRMVLNNIPQRVFWKDREMIFQGCNLPMARDCGFKDPADMIGKSDFEMTTAENAERYRAVDLEVMANDRPKLDYELIETRSDGSTAYFLVKKVPLHDKEGRVIGVLGAYEDITQRKQLEEQFRQAQKMEAIGRLAGGVAHDFNNLLTVICGYSEILLGETAAGDPACESLTEIKKAGERAAGLTRQLLAFSRKQVLEPDVLDLNTIISDCEKMLGRLLGENIELKVALDPGLGRIKADSSQIDQVLLNLVVNARDAMPRGGKLLLETSNTVLDDAYCLHHDEVKPGKYVTLTVTDNGCGMDEDTLAHIFEPFFTTKEQGKGTGLGLAMIFGFIKQSGGHVSVTSEPDRGSTFKIFLPEYEEPAES